MEQTPRVNSETNFWRLLESAPDPIVIVSQDGRIRMVNSQFERVFGYSQPELIDQSIEILLPYRFHKLHTQHREEYVTHPTTRPMGIGLNLVARRKNGEEFPVEISLSPFEFEEGLLTIAVVRDITDRKRAAAELERQVQQRTRQLNAVLQFSQELLFARSLDEVLQQALRRAMALAPETNRGVIYLYDDETNTLTLHASIGFSPLPQLRVATNVCILGIAFTSRQTFELHSAAEYRALAPGLTREEREQILRVLHIEQIPSGVMALPLLARDQAIGVLLLLREQGAGPFASDARMALETLGNLTAAAIVEERFRRQAKTLSTQVADLEAEQQRMAERLNYAEAGMLQAARLAAVGQLAASIAHEINNPLYAARNCLFLLEEDLPPTLRDSSYLTLARDQLDRIAGIISRMRNFYRPSRGEMAPHNINYLLEETLALAGLNLRHGTIQMIFTPAPDLPDVVCNADQLRQVFLNLVMNAIEAMPNGGTLTVRTEPTDLTALIEVRDTGVGIPESVRERIFEPFFTNKPSGTGLGLAISQHIVMQHNGRIEVESRENKGSTFRVSLPYQPTV